MKQHILENLLLWALALLAAWVFGPVTALRVVGFATSFYLITMGLGVLLLMSRPQLAQVRQTIDAEQWRVVEEEQWRLTG